MVNAIENAEKQKDTLTSSALGFIDRQVLKDYDTLVKIGEQYSKDTEFAADLVTDFSAEAEELSASVQDMLKAIGEVSEAANNGEQGTSDIANKSALVAEKADGVMKQADISKESSDVLIKPVEKFRVQGAAAAPPIFLAEARL